MCGCIAPQIVEATKAAQSRELQAVRTAKQVAGGKKKAKKKQAKKLSKVQKKKIIKRDFVQTDEFLKSYEWRKLRMQVLVKYGARCQCCGATAKDGVRIHVDHIKPRKKFPELALVVANLQVACEVCNHGKGNWDETDWRPKVGESG